MPVCSNHKVTTVIIPSSNLRAAMPRAGLVLMSEATVPQRTRRVHRLRSSIAGNAPQRAPLSGSSGSKLALRGEARTQALLSVDPFCRDKRSRTSSYTRSKRASVLDCLGPSGSDLQELLTNKQTSSSCCQQVGCHCWPKGLPL